RATIADADVRSAVTRPIVTGWAAVHYMTSAVCKSLARSTCRSATPNIAARPAGTASVPTPPTSHHPAATTPTESSPWPFVWWWRTDCRTAPHPGICGVTTASSSPMPPSRTGSKQREKKANARLETYRDWALTNFSGYLVLDEMYDGPFCVLCAVDGPKQHRLLYQVLDHDADQDDIRRFLRRLKLALLIRNSTVHGITTDGSSLYPVPLAEFFAGVPHQVCEFHILKELNKVVLRVVARLRRRLAAEAPKLPRGRPRQDRESRRKARQTKRIDQRVSELFDH